MSQRQSAMLALADGTVFYGDSIGISGTTVGEVVFNTALTGYQEILTDPSYSQQMILFTQPHIGINGVNSQDNESDKLWAAGVIVRECDALVSHWRAEHDLGAWLLQKKVVGIAGIDTRALTRHLSEHGVQNGCISSEHDDPEKVIGLAKEAPNLSDLDLANKVSCKAPYVWPKEQRSDVAWPHVVVVDFGVKRHILDLLHQHQCRLTVVPASTSLDAIMALEPKAVVLSNGPGNPDFNQDIIKLVQALMAKPIALFGICFGFQVLALAAGGRTYKMPFGHHGANHPVAQLSDNRVLITSQNHGFAVDETSLPKEFVITHRSLFDGSLQGFAHQSRPIIGVQGHPEASPGPQDWQMMFQQFISLLT